MLVPSSLSVTTWGGDRIDVFGIGTNGCIYHKGGVGDGWYQNAWTSLVSPRVPFTGVSAVSWGPNRVDVLGVGTDAATYHKSGTFQIKWGKPQASWQPPNWEPLNGALAGPPTTVSTAVGQLDVFGISMDGGACTNSWGSGAWTGWSSLGSPSSVTFTGTLSAISWGGGLLAVFGQGSDGNIWFLAGTSGDWTGFQWRCLHYSSSTSFESDPAAVSWGPSRMDVFCVGIDNQIWHNFFETGGPGSDFAGWKGLGGQFISVPCVVSRGANLIDVLGIGTEGAVWHNAWANNKWSGFIYNLGSPNGVVFVSAPSAVATSSERLDVFALGDDGHTYHKSWISGSWAQSWDTLKGKIVVSEPPQNIGLRMQYQQMYDWCWLAVASSIIKFYDPTSLATQSGIVTQLGPTYNQFPPGTSCLPTPTVFQANPDLVLAWEDPYAPTSRYAFEGAVANIPQICDHGGDVATALLLYGAISPDYDGQSPMSLDEIAQQLSQGQPVAVGITWNASSESHCVAVVGVADNLLLISDPALGELVIEYENFPAEYNGGANSPNFYVTGPPNSFTANFV